MAPSRASLALTGLGRRGAGLLQVQAIGVVAEVADVAQRLVEALRGVVVRGGLQDQALGPGGQGELPGGVHQQGPYPSPAGGRGVGGEAKHLLVGPFESELDPLQPETLKVIETHPNIISVGFQSDVRLYFAISDCLVFPSYREGFPNVVMQAGAMGLPSIVTNINGCNEIIVEGENGTIIPVKNVATLVDAMQKMIYDTSYYQHLRQNARPMIQSRYEQLVVWEALLEEYRRVLEV